MRVLVVDDDPAIAQLVGAVVVGEGHTARQVGTGGQALSAALQEEFDLVLCDLNLPDVTGDEIVRALKAQTPHLPVVVMSAMNKEDWAKPCEDAGASRYLEKPIGIETLRQEMALVERARLYLNIGVVDHDPIHRTRLCKLLASFGCQTHPFETPAEAVHWLDGGASASLLLVDADAPGAVELVGRCMTDSVPAFTFAENYDDAGEDALMRAGAAFLLGKPVNVDNLLNQMAFLANR